jgi:hypothetical protein
MALAAQAVLNRRPLWPALLVALALSGCVSAPPEREPAPPPPPPTAPGQGASLPPAQPLPRPTPPAVVVRPGPPPSAPPLGEPMTPPAPAAQPSATGSLIALADRQAATGDYASAAAQLERALRIRPQDPVLWQKLAWLRLQNGEFDQAASLAARSDALAGSNAAVRDENRRIVEFARARQRP